MKGLPDISKAIIRMAFHEYYKRHILGAIARKATKPVSFVKHDLKNFSASLLKLALLEIASPILRCKIICHSAHKRK